MPRRLPPPRPAPPDDAGESLVEPAQGVPAQGLPGLFGRFLRFGMLAWGGPVAQIAMIKRELVEEERWISVGRFNRVLAVYQVLPGPEAHELCVYFGMLARGRAGALVAGLGFMLPGLVLMLLLSWAYVTFGLRTGEAVAAFAGLQAAVVALVVRGVHRIGRHAVTAFPLWAVAVTSFAASLLGVHFAWILGTGAVVYPLLRRLPWAMGAAALLALAAAVLWAPRAPEAAAVAHEATDPSPAPLGSLGLSGLRAGLLTFGGAYTAIPLLQQDTVVAGRWLTNDQFLDGIALGGVLPAPLIIFGTFVGFVAGGWAGALLVTVGIFLPAFLFTLVGHGALERLTEERRMREALAGVMAAVVGLIAATLVALGRAALQDPGAWAIFAVALVALYRLRSRATIPLVMLGAAAAGFLLGAP